MLKRTPQDIGAPGEFVFIDLLNVHCRAREPVDIETSSRKGWGLGPTCFEAKAQEQTDIWGHAMTATLPSHHLQLMPQWRSQQPRSKALPKHLPALYSKSLKPTSTSISNLFRVLEASIRTGCWANKPSDSPPPNALGDCKWGSRRQRT